MSNNKVIQDKDQEIERLKKKIEIERLEDKIFRKENAMDSLEEMYDQYVDKLTDEIERLEDEVFEKKKVIEYLEEIYSQEMERLEKR